MASPREEVRPTTGKSTITTLRPHIVETTTTIFTTVSPLNPARRHWSAPIALLCPGLVFRLAIILSLHAAPFCASHHKPSVLRTLSPLFFRFFFQIFLIFVSYLQEIFYRAHAIQKASHLAPPAPSRGER